MFYSLLLFIFLWTLFVLFQYRNEIEVELHWTWILPGDNVTHSVLVLLYLLAEVNIFDHNPLPEIYSLGFEYTTAFILFSF